MEDPFHPTRAEELGERKKNDEDEGKESSGRFASQDKRAKNELGVPGDDRLIEIKKDRGRSIAHAKRML
jgi:hypothetical protein